MPTVSSYSHHGVTWNFSAPVEYGLWADGNPWFQVPFTINSITPDWDGTYNGYEVNPVVDRFQGFAANYPSPSTTYDAAKRPALPYAVTTECSIVKAIGRNSTADSNSVIKTAAVITAVVAIPEGGGVGIFRPPYVGTAKPQYRVADLNTSLIPSYAPAGTPLTMAEIVTRFSRCLYMDHKESQVRYLRPHDVLTAYQPKNIKDQVSDPMLSLMVDRPMADRMDAIVQYTQMCIDRAHCVLLGYRHGATGHNPGHRIMAAWAAKLLNITSVLDVLAVATGMHDRHVIASVLDGRALWGESATESQYWNYLRGLGGSQSNADPYGYIDGGRLVTTGSGGPGASYQKIVSQNIKGEVLCAVLMPALQAAYRADHWPTWRAYADRWVSFGVWALPDPAAPYTSGGTYLVNYGPDPDGPGPILGAGRFPTLHGLNPNGGQYPSELVNNMWDAHRFSDEVPPPPPPPVDPTSVAKGPGRRGAKRLLAALR